MHALAFFCCWADGAHQLVHGRDETSTHLAQNRASRAVSCALRTQLISRLRNQMPTWRQRLHHCRSRDRRCLRTGQFRASCCKPFLRGVIRGSRAVSQAHESAPGHRTKHPHPVTWRINGGNLVDSNAQHVNDHRGMIRRQVVVPMYRSGNATDLRRLPQHHSNQKCSSRGSPPSCPIPNCKPCLKSQACRWPQHPASGRTSILGRFRHLWLTA